jgi:hypothetical protein
MARARLILRKTGEERTAIVYVLWYSPLGDTVLTCNVKNRTLLFTLSRSGSMRRVLTTGTVITRVFFRLLCCQRDSYDEL